MCLWQYPLKLLAMQITDMGIEIPGKTIFPFGSLVLFTDDSDEERRAQRNIRCGGCGNIGNASDYTS
jgi:hypothetical protein